MHLEAVQLCTRDTGEFGDGVEVDFDSEAGFGGDGEHSLGIELPAALGDVVDEGGAGEVFDEVGIGEGGGEVEVGGEAERGVPAVGDEADAVIAGHLGDAAFFADAAAFGDVGLDDVEGAVTEPGFEGLAAGEDFAAGDGDFGGAAEGDVVIEGVGWQSFFKPENVVGREHFRGAEGPFEILRPEGVAGSGIDHEKGIGADGFAGGFDDGFIGGSIAAAEGAPTDLEGAEALGFDWEEFAGHAFRFAHEQGSVGANAFAVAATEETADGLIAGLAE